MKTEKSIQFLSNNRKLIAGPCKKQFFLSFYLFYYIHTPVPPLSQANQSDGNRVAREVGFDHHLTTSSPQPVPLIVCTLQHSFITTTNNAESCAHYTISGAVSWHLPARHSSPTRKAAGSNPPAAPKAAPVWALPFLFCMRFYGRQRGDSNSCKGDRRLTSRRAKKPLRGFFRARRAQYPLWLHKTRTLLHHAEACGSHRSKRALSRFTNARSRRCTARWCGRR